MANYINSTDVKVYNEFLTLAVKVFNTAMQVPEARRRYASEGGSMTASQLNKWSEAQVLFHNDSLNETLGLPDGIATVQVDGFKCQFRVCEVFSLMDHFAHLAHAGKHVFLATAERDEPVHSCTLSLGDARALKKLANFTNKPNSLCPSMEMVCLQEYDDFSHIAIVATNGHKIAVVKSFDDVHAEHSLSGSYFFTRQQWRVLCDYAAKNANAVHVSFYKEKDGSDFCVFDIDGRELESCTINERYPNWRGIMPKSEDIEWFSMQKKEAKMLCDFVKRIAKTYGEDATFYLSTYEDSTVAWIDSQYGEFSQKVHLEQASALTRFRLFRAKSFLSAPVNGFGLPSDRNDTLNRILLSSPAADIFLLCGCDYERSTQDGITIPDNLDRNTVLSRLPMAARPVVVEPFTFQPAQLCLPAPAAVLCLPEPVKALPAVVAVQAALPVPATVADTVTDQEPVEEVTPVTEAETANVPVAPCVETPLQPAKPKATRKPAAAKVCLWAKFNTLYGDRINVRIEAINEQLQTATIRTKGWNRYSVPLNRLTPTSEEGFTLPAWIKQGEYVISDNDCGFITDAGRTYVIIDCERQYTYLDIMLNFMPQEAAIGELVCSKPSVANGGAHVMDYAPALVAAPME